MEEVDRPPPSPVVEKSATTTRKTRPIVRQASTEAPIANLASVDAAGTKKKTTSKMKSSKSASMKGDSEFKKFSRINSMIAHPTEDLTNQGVKKFNRTLTIADGTSAPKKKTSKAPKGSRRASLKADETDDDMLTPTGDRRNREGDSSAFEDDASTLSSKFKAAVSLPKHMKAKAKSSKDATRAGDNGSNYDSAAAPSGSEMDSDAPGHYSRAMTTGQISRGSKGSTSGRRASSSKDSDSSQGPSASRTLTTPKEGSSGGSLKSSLKKSSSQKVGSGLPPGPRAGSVSGSDAGSVVRSPKGSIPSAGNRVPPGRSNMGQQRNIPHSQSDSVAMQHIGQQDGYGGMQAGMMPQGGYGLPQNMSVGMMGPDGWMANQGGMMGGNPGMMGQAGMMQMAGGQQGMMQMGGQGPAPPAGDLSQVDVSMLPMLPLPSMPQIVQCQRCNQLLEVPQILPPAKKGVQKLRCGKCLRVSRFRENPADPRSSCFNGGIPDNESDAGFDGMGQLPQQHQQQQQQLLQPQVPPMQQQQHMGGIAPPQPNMGMQQFPGTQQMQQHLRPPGQPPFNQGFPPQGMPPGMQQPGYGGMGPGPYGMGGMNAQYGMNPQMMNQQFMGQQGPMAPQFQGQMGFNPQAAQQMGYNPQMMNQGLMNQGGHMGYPQGMQQQHPSHMQPGMHQQPQVPNQQMRKPQPQNPSSLPSPSVDESDSGSVIVKRGVRGGGPNLGGPGNQSGRQKRADGYTSADQQFPRNNSGSGRTPVPIPPAGGGGGMHRGGPGGVYRDGSMESGDTMSGSGSPFPLSPMAQAAGYSTGGSGNMQGQVMFTRRVAVNGEAISDDIVQMAEEKAGPIQPGNYWYDEIAGFWGQLGGPCLGIIPPGVNFGPLMPRLCAGGTTGILVNGRELHAKDLERLMKRGLPTIPNSAYRVEINGNVFDEQSGDFVMSLGKLAPSLETRKRGTGMKMPEVVAQ